jgi:hypothetical protein
MGLTEPTPSSKTVRLFTEVKHLGLTLDKRLTCKAQLYSFMNRTYRAFWTSIGSLEKTWALKPKVLY